MAKFVRVHKSGVECLLNLDDVTAVIKTKDGRANCVMDYQENIVDEIVDETYEQMCKIIGSAQGGIPMEESRMY